jgi:(R,R)-butanediol dehydrogenase/meso-butanediol dehydrogenase/diacetyl reductase
MQAAVFKAVGQPLLIEQIADPTPVGRDVVISVSRCGICGSDLHMTEDPALHLPSGTVLGHEYAGEIVSTGPAVEQLRVGDRVVVVPIRSCGRCAECLAGKPGWCTAMRLEAGGYAQYSVADERQCIRLPNSLSMPDGAIVEPLAVALHGVRLSGLVAGAKVLVIGAGAIGLAVAFWARRLGAGRIAMTDTLRSRGALAIEMGATCFVDPLDNGPEAVDRALGGPPDIVFEAVGKPGLIAQSIAQVRPRGTVVVLGICTSADTFVPVVAVDKGIRIQCSALYEIRDFEITIDTLEAGVVAPRHMVTDTVPLGDMPAAFEALRHRTTQCKVLVHP